MEKKKPGRPKKETTAKLIRMPNDLIDKLDKEADKEGQTFPGIVISILSKAFKK